MIISFSYILTSDDNNWINLLQCNVYNINKHTYIHEFILICPHSNELINKFMYITYCIQLENFHFIHLLIYLCV